MVLRTAAPFLLLGIVAVNLVLLPTVTHSYTISQGSDDGDLVFVDEPDHHRNERSTSDEKDTSLRRNAGLPNNTTKRVSSAKSAVTLLEDGPVGIGVPIIGSNDEGLPKSLTENIRGKRQYSVLPPSSDDEDFGPNFGSGEEDIVEGSGHGSGLYRVKILVDGQYLPAYADKNSPEFADLAVQVQYPLEQELSKLPGQANARLTRIRRSTVPNQLELLVDITHSSDQSEEDRIRSIIYKFELQGNMGSLTNVVIESFREEQGPIDICPGDNKFVCPGGSLIICHEQRCDGALDCWDGKDEENCGCISDLCDDGRCISEEKRCDGTPDCIEATDEQDCPCAGGHQRCLSGECLPEELFCNSVQNCIDGSDEAPSTCGSEPSCSLPDEFLCDSGKRCLPLFKRCDSVPDCDDQSDEQGCDCSLDQFKCRDDGTCIEDFYRCDGNGDCFDGSDEAPSVCGSCLPSQHTCAADDKCLPSWVTCDGTNDCQDGSDENLQKCCIAGFWCDGICMDSTVNCNGLLECQDKTDEMGCPQLPVTCRADQFQCGDGSCIENFQRCDKAQDCPGAEDEENCPCQPPNYECLSGMCISESKLCDGIDDCDDGSDEFSCPCKESEFECTDDGRCITASERCDGVANCYDESDESNCASCSGNAFRCGNGQCIEQELVCDGDKDCDTDEMDCPATDRVCPPGMFRCDEGSCIPITQRCDGSFQCPDASDEDECGCPVDQFRCRDDSCIPVRERCDQVYHCADGSDELNCPDPCTKDQFKCDLVRCLPRSSVCNGIPECLDSTDERDCECRGGEWQCSDGQCVPDYLRCDGVTQCRDGSDEGNCITDCTAGQWQCGNGQCIPSTGRCDGTTQCADKADELGCAQPGGCDRGQWLCADGQTCIPLAAVCDDVIHCPDLSDEATCRACASFEWQCADRSCIPATYRCDGPPHCPDASDEMGCTTVSCPEGYWLCRDQLSCVPNWSVCDGRPNCPDYSDENRCPGRPACTSEEWQCQDGSCIPDYLKCDGAPHCPDRSDELDCVFECRQGQWMCMDGTCIPETLLCDRTPHCPDRSDELLCPAGCLPDEWQCSDGSCVPASAVCDGRPQCPDRSDERRCPVSCQRGEWQCHDGLGCIPQSLHCDGVPHCTDGTDEMGCPECRPDQWQCHDTACILRSQKCDGTPDCYDRSDEQDCTGPPPSACRADEFQCKDGNCVPESVRCDGQVYCHDGSDEHGCENGATPVPCDVGMLSCHDNGYCYDASLQCDGHKICHDGSDELNCAPVPCRPGHWRCRDGTCLPDYLRCDGAPQCSDRSDEADCPVAPACGASEWQCRDGTCLPDYLRCDGAPHCPDRSDEADCPVVSCGSDDWRCRDGTCIPAYLKCDSAPHCPDRSDESDCPVVPSCGSNDWRCRDGTCIPAYLKCDGAPHCRDRSDESDCPVAPACGASEWQCRDGTCLPDYLRCDGAPHCPDRSDEADCPVGCGVGEWQCSDGTCLPEYLKCDGIPHCPDRSDESGCQPACDSSREWQCDYGTCIALALRCDGRLDCPSDNSDERDCPVRCRSDQYRCGDGRCLELIQRCNGAEECSSGEDERGCSPGPCGSYQFRCHRGPCIDVQYRCNGRVECPFESSDEQGCPPACAPDQFQCGDRSCVPAERRCDRYSDCLDDTDETGCPEDPSASCPSGSFTCNNGDCVSASQRCDGQYQCLDRSDEVGCPPGCALGEFQCTDLSCVPDYLRCDGRYDCSDGGDERQCRCIAGEFTCNNEKCVDEARKCNGVDDCGDNSDEVQCDLYTCNSGQSIPGSQRCDGFADCQDGSDEGPQCGSGQGCSRADEFQCDSRDQCIPSSAVCNRAYDCRDYSDESPAVCGGETGPDIPGYDAILLKTYPDRQSIKQSREVVFQCRDEGRLRSAVRWSRPDNQVMPLGYSDQRGRLTIPNIQLADAGVYFCEAVGVAPNTPGWRRTVTLEVVPFAIAITTPAPSVCAVSQATCMNGECIPKSAVCDGDADCSDASDEMRCSPLGCEPNEFQCDNKRCVLKTWICDSDDDCGDGSDERNCGPPKPGDKCNINEFACSTMEQCIPKSFHCDGEVDCSDLTDELGCSRPIFTEPPPRTYTVEVTQTFILTCRAIGVPTPTVIWRLNWGHVPDKCTMTSVDGYGVLTCRDARPTDQGAYSCEAINIKGSVFAIPDTIVVVTGGPGSVCEPPLFNAAASSAPECLECFCFGAATECFSTDRYVSQLPPPSSGTFELVGVNQDQVEGKYVIRDSQYPLQSRFVSTNFLGSTELKVPDRTRLGGPSDLVIFFSLPNSHRGSKLMSYGGYLRYKIMFTGVGAGQPVFGPDVIIRGNGLTLMHVHDGTLLSERENQVDVRFWPGQWYKSVILSNNRVQSNDVATREEILMALEDVELLLIRALYVDALIVDAKLSDVQLDTAVIGETAQGRAVYVEECRCPQGYTGLSCEECAPNFRRAPGGRWLGRCVPDVECRAGEYGDPANNIPCLPCPCPLTNYPNQFGRSCYLDTDGQVTCNCPNGYAGRRCESCTVGFEGNPSVTGDYCKPAGECNPAGSASAVVDPRTGQCQCKEFTTGPKCGQCKDGSFYLNEKNVHGCIQCFCMGITRTCASSNLYRTQVAINFQGRGSQGVALVDQRQETVITDFPPNDQGELVYNNFSRQGGELFYWRLPAQFLGNKVTSYGGDLIFTLRYVPSPGGSSSKNNAYVVEINGNSVTLRYYGRQQQQLAGNRAERVVVPLYENYWQRQDGQPANREHVLMALARINYILIKATYTTTTSEVGLESASMDIAEERNTGGPRAGAVEVCSCEPGYKGLSCEECAAGYTRGLSGLYLGVCVRCDCNGHSDECDPDNNECVNCRDNTAGFFCEECLPGYTMDSSTGSCYRTGSECSCDPRGSVSDQCLAGVCQCKEGVQGDNCNLCRSGFFDLAETNPQGCSRCWCSGVTNQCFASNFQRMEIPMNLIGEDHGFVITNRARTDVKRDGLRVNIRDNEISFTEFNLLSDRDTYYWSLPQAFTGNLLPSYGGNLAITQRYESGSGSTVLREADVIIRGSNGQEMVWMKQEPLPRGRDTTYDVPLTEASFTINQYPVTRSEFLQVLSSVEAILLRATPNTDLSSTTLSNVILDTAVSSPTGLGRATTVEQCLCPNEYKGLSCEDCMPGFYRDSNSNRCLQCICNGHEESCEEGPDGRPKCNCIAGYYGDYCEKSGPVPPSPDDGVPSGLEARIDEPRIQVVVLGSTVTYFCRTDSVPSTNRLYVSWSRRNGELPYGRASDDRNGRLVINQVQVADSGKYVCTISDGFDLVLQTEASLTVEDHRSPERPTVVIEEQQETVEVTVGQYYEVRCLAQGYPTPRISWSRTDGLPLPSEVVVQNGLLTFRQVTPRASGTYVCRGINEGGLAQAIITIVVEEGTTEVEVPEPPGGGYITVTVTQTEVEVITGGTVRVDCSAPAQFAYATVEWSRINGQLPQLSSQNNGQLVIPNAQPQDSGLYLCTIQTQEGGYGEATTRIQIIRTYNVPTVRVEPDRQTINQGSSAEVRCTAFGEPAPKISWSKVNGQFGRGVVVDGEVLRITNAEVSDRGMYVCDALNSGGSARAVTVIEVERREPPSVKMYPDVRQSLLPGHTALFQCHLTGGIPMPEITWERSDKRPLTPNTEVKPGGIITFYEVTGNEQGTYICTARNDAGEVRSTAILEILSLPSISIRPNQSPYEVLEGARIRLECSASGDPVPTIAWQLLRTNYPTDVQSRSVSPTSIEYEIVSVRLEDAGTYRCTATNSAGTSEEIIRVIVNPVLPGTPNYRPTVRPSGPGVGPPAPRPSGSTDNKVARVPVGANYEFRCILTETSITEVQTSFHRSDQQPLPRGSRVQEGILFLYNVQPEDAGEYACVGSNRDRGQILYTIYATVLVVAPPSIVLEPTRQVVRPGDHVSLHCRATGDQPITITWSKQRSRMPASVIISGGEMMFRGITPSDAGQYICEAINSAGTARAVAEVVVNEEPLVAALTPDVSALEGQSVELRCEASGMPPNRVRWTKDGGPLPANAFPRDNVLSLNNVDVNNRGSYICEAFTDSGFRTYDTITLRVDRQRNVDIKVDVRPRNPRVGEAVELSCNVAGDPRAVVAWTRYGGRLPPQARQFGPMLRLTALRPDDGGIYVCAVTTASGVFEATYALVIKNLISSDVINYGPNSRSVETRSAEFGSTVVMACHAELEPPASFTWMKQDGQLPFQATVKEETLEIPSVHAEDAGTYLCTARNDQRSVDLPVLLLVTGVVPSFNGNSYLALPTLSDAYLRFDIEVSFRPDSADGIILYNSRSDERSGDYVAFGLQDGFAVYQFDVGAGMMSIRSLEPLALNEWHTVKLSRNRKNGRMSVDGEATQTETTEGRHVGLELLEPLYVGGVPDGTTLNGQANFTRGFRGCISRFVIKDSITELMRVAEEKVNVADCRTCGENPCQNSGVCQESYSEKGYKCICSAGFSGEICSETGDTCFPGLCGNGRCVNRPGGYDCFCPYGKTGMHCEHDIIITEPSFSSKSFIAYQTPNAIKRFSMGMRVKPTQELRDGLLMYCAQNEQGDGDFTSLALRNKRLEFRFNTGTGTATLTSDELPEGDWVKIYANRTDRFGSLRVNDGELINGESPGVHKGLNLRIPLYLGGVDANRVEVSSEVEVTDGFTGCISQINVNERELSIADMGASLVDSANIGQCNGAQDPEGVCSLKDPCTNGGVCHDDRDSYTCVCPLGYSGQHCEHETVVEDSASFSGTSWVEFDKHLLMSEDRRERSVTLEFTTTVPNGLLLWLGQDATTSGKGFDFFSLAFKNGFLELQFRTRDGEGSLRSSVRLDDGTRHSLRAVLGEQLATLQLDNLPVETAALPSNAPVNARGGLFLGGVPEPELMTDSAYSSGFDGCLHGVSLGGNRVDTISESALSGVDVVSCSRFRRMASGETSYAPLPPFLSQPSTAMSFSPASSSVTLTSSKYLPLLSSPSSAPILLPSLVLQVMAALLPTLGLWASRWWALAS